MHGTVSDPLHRHDMVLQNFTKLDTSIQYIDWQTAVKIGQDDSLTELDYSVPPETGDRFRLETVIPANSKYGNLVFETAGMNLTVSIDEKRCGSPKLLCPRERQGRPRRLFRCRLIPNVSLPLSAR